MKPAARAWLPSVPSELLLSSSTRTRPPSSSARVKSVFKAKFLFSGAYEGGRPFKTRRLISCSDISMSWYCTFRASDLARAMYSLIVSASSILSPSKFFLACSFALSLLSSSTILFSIFHASDGALARTTMSAIVLSFSTAFVRPFHTVSDCATICLPCSLSNSLRELSPVMIIGRLWFSASSDWEDKAHVWKCFRNLDRLLRSPEYMGTGNLSVPACWFYGGKGAEPRSTCLLKYVILFSWLSTLILKSSRVSPVRSTVCIKPFVDFFNVVAQAPKLLQYFLYCASLISATSF